MYKVKVTLTSTDETPKQAVVIRNPAEPSKILKPDEPIEFEVFAERHQDVIEMFLTDADV